jgi:LacI family transcriptional regulator
VWNSEVAAEAAVQHLIEIGRRRIAFLGVDYPGLGTLHRFKAYCRVLRENGLALHNDWIARPTASLAPEDIARLALDQFFSKKQPVPDAIFALNDGLALPALGQLEAKGFSVPGDVAIIGMGNLPLSAHPAIGLSTLREPVEEMGQAAASLLLEMITGKAATPVRRALSSCEVFARRTTACKQR